MRTLITREDPEPLCSLLEVRGLEWVHTPLVSLHRTAVKPPDFPPEWVVITSSAVSRFVPDLADYIGHARVVAVGPRTAASLVAMGISVSETGTLGGLDALASVPADRMGQCWYVGAVQPSAKLRSALEQRGVARWSVYENRIPPTAAASLRSARFDCVTFASGSAVQAFVGVMGIPTVPVAVLGPTTADVARSLGVHVDSVAKASTMEALATAVADLSRNSCGV